MAKIVDIDDHGQPLEDIKFKLKIHKDQAEEKMSYNQLMDYIQKGTDAEEDPDSLFKFRDIVAHQGPLESTDPDHKGSRYNVMVEWESGEITYEPLALILRMTQSLVQFMQRNMISLTQQDGNTSKGMLKHLRDSSELSSSQGFAKLEHQLDTNMVSKSQGITMMQ